VSPRGPIQQPQRRIRASREARTPRTSALVGGVFPLIRRRRAAIRLATSLVTPLIFFAVDIASFTRQLT